MYMRNLMESYKGMMRMSIMLVGFDDRKFDVGIFSFCSDLSKKVISKCYKNIQNFNFILLFFHN